MSSDITISTEVGTSIEIADALATYTRQAEGAFAENTVRAIRGDTAIFTCWCVERGMESLPASAVTVAQFIDSMSESRKPATICTVPPARTIRPRPVLLNSH